MPKSLISVQDLTKEEILHILDVAREFEENREQSFLSGKVVACLFFEPSGSVPGLSDSLTTATPARPRVRPWKIL